MPQFSRFLVWFEHVDLRFARTLHRSSLNETTFAAEVGEAPYVRVGVVGAIGTFSHVVGI